MIDWKRLPAGRTAPPFDGCKALLAVPTADAEYPYTIHLGCWGEHDVLFYTETRDEDGEIVWLARDEVAFWAAVDMPGADEFVAIPRIT